MAASQGQGTPSHHLEERPPQESLHPLVCFARLRNTHLLCQVTETRGLRFLLQPSLAQRTLRCKPYLYPASSRTIPQMLIFCSKQQTKCSTLPPWSVLRTCAHADPVPSCPFPTPPTGQVPAGPSRLFEQSCPRQSCSLSPRPRHSATLSAENLQVSNINLSLSTPLHPNPM